MHPTFSSETDKIHDSPHQTQGDTQWPQCSLQGESPGDPSHLASHREFENYSPDNTMGSYELSLQDAGELS